MIGFRKPWLSQDFGGIDVVVQFSSWELIPEPELKISVGSCKPSQSCLLGSHSEVTLSGKNKSLMRYDLVRADAYLTELVKKCKVCSP
ncbi:hypothetical protein C9J45_03985 [Photobacterium sp. GB-1]|nr:hypothetical protein C9J45_03985 [Photobacterium sp. GB-1]